MCTLPGGSLHPAWAGCKIRVPPEIRPAPCLAGHASRHNATTQWPPTWIQEGMNVFIFVDIDFLFNLIRSKCDWARAGGRSRVGRSRNRSVGPSVCPSGGRPTSWGPRWGCWGVASIEKYFPNLCGKYVVSIVVCLFCCSLSLIRWALQVMRDAQFSLSKSSRHVFEK